MAPMILLTRAEPVAEITPNREARHNSFTPGLLEALLAAIDSLHPDPTLRAVLLQASGRSFSTGGDLQGFADHLETAQAYAETLVGLLNRVILALFGLHIPVVAAVQGPVNGGALGLVLAADVVLVTPEAGFTPYYSAVGFSPDGGWTALLPVVIGPKRAAEVLYCNRTISASQAVEWGLASRIVPRDRLQAEAQRVCREIANGYPGSQQRTRKLLHPLDLANRLASEMDNFIAQIGAAETQERMLHFLAGM